MTPLKLTAAKNKWTGFLLRVRRKVATLKAICNNPGKQGRLAIMTTRLAESWQEYENSQQDVLGLVTKDEVENEQVTFIKMEEIYKAAINDANGIIKGNLRAEEGRDSLNERTVHLTRA